MRQKIVPIKNVGRLSEAADALLTRASGLPGMGLVRGDTGAGKTTAVCWLVNRVNGVYVRATAVWSPATALRAILREIDLDARGSNSDLVECIVEELAKRQRPLFVDEADYLVGRRMLIDTMRDIHDLSTVPVILIGMDGIQRSVATNRILAGRIAQEVQFAPCDAEDARMLADQLCEVAVADDLLGRLHAKATGSVRLIVVGLARIEAFARTRALENVDSAAWGRADNFFLGGGTVAAPPAARVTRIKSA